MISTQGMTSSLAMSLIGRTRETFEDGVRNGAVAKREIAAFKDRIGSIENVDDLLGDYETYSFVMKAFGLEDEIPAKAMNKKIMTSDPDDSSSLVNRLTSTVFKALNKDMGFATDGSADDRLKDPLWVDAMVELYVDQRFIDGQTEMNEPVGIALDFQRKAEGLTSWYKVLADEGAAKVMRVALGLPESIGSADVDAQKRLFEKKMDIEDLQDPKVLESLVRRYTAISDANTAILNPTSTALTLLTQATTSGTYSMITLDIDLVQGFKGSSFY